MTRIMIILGTRPEAIKMAPVIRKLKNNTPFQVRIAVTAQHRQMLDQVLDLFKIRPDYDLNLMKSDQDLFDITANVIQGVKEILMEEKPDLVLVHGDTTTTFSSALASFYLRIPVGHVEAGLRTREKYRPFPEEINRRLTGILADFHFAPTQLARKNLLEEGFCNDRIWITGNTIIDSLQIIADKVRGEKEKWAEYFVRHHGLNLDGRRLILVTGHRRENFGPGFENICLALRDVAQHFPDIHIVYPVHLNPNVQGQVYKILSKEKQEYYGEAKSTTFQAESGGCVSLLPPLEYTPFVYLMSQSYLVLTDSGGVQEEAPSLGKPVLVMRDVTERPEGIWAGTAKLVGTDQCRIYKEVKELLEVPVCYTKMAQARNPYGDGLASERITQIIANLFKSDILTKER
jgi:UDP-N-acetylglucosamine 2-epimerase (non-hydrolysing)